MRGFGALAVLALLLPIAARGGSDVDVVRIHGRIHLGEHFPDFTIRYVEHCPGPQ